MKLEKKKEFIARAKDVGKSRIIFNVSRLQDIKQSITKQDINELIRDKAVIIKEVGGRKTLKKRKTRRRAGSIKKKVNNRKQEYVKLVRKLRLHVAHLKKSGKLSIEDYNELRKQIRSNEFKSLANMKEKINERGILK